MRKLRAAQQNCTTDVIHGAGRSGPRESCWCGGYVVARYGSRKAMDGRPMMIWMGGNYSLKNTITAHAADSAWSERRMIGVTMIMGFASDGWKLKRGPKTGGREGEPHEVARAAAAARGSGPRGWGGLRGAALRVWKEVDASKRSDYYPKLCSADGFATLRRCVRLSSPHLSLVEGEKRASDDYIVESSASDNE